MVIPAHDEAAVIGRTLRRLTTGVEPGQLEVVVACNGCTDDTVGAATSSGVPVTIVDLPEAGKARAIRAAEAMVTTLPRLYLDADVGLDGQSALAVVRALRGGAVAARPPFVYDTGRASRLVRRYYRQRGRLPGVGADLCGAGVYGLSASARARFGPFPDVIADDLFAARVVTASEVTIVDCAPAEVVVPADVWSLVRTLARAHRGNRQLFVRSPDFARGTTGPIVSSLLHSLARPNETLDAVVYAGVAVAGRIAARGNATTWARDHTSRVVPA